MDTRELNPSSAARKAANEIMAVGCLSEVEIAAIIDRHAGESEEVSRVVEIEESEREKWRKSVSEAWALLAEVKVMLTPTGRRYAGNTYIVKKYDAEQFVRRIDAFKTKLLNRRYYKKKGDAPCKT